MKSSPRRWRRRGHGIEPPCAAARGAPQRWPSGPTQGRFHRSSPSPAHPQSVWPRFLTRLCAGRRRPKMSKWGSRPRRGAMCGQTPRSQRERRPCRRACTRRSEYGRFMAFGPASKRPASAKLITSPIPRPAPPRPHASPEMQPTLNACTRPARIIDVLSEKAGAAKNKPSRPRLKGFLGRRITRAQARRGFHRGPRRVVHDDPVR